MPLPATLATYRARMSPITHRRRWDPSARGRHGQARDDDAEVGDHRARDCGSEAAGVVGQLSRLVAYRFAQIRKRFERITALAHDAKL